MLTRTDARGVERDDDRLPGGALHAEPLDFSDLRAPFVNCTLKPSPELSHTEGLMRISMAIVERNGVDVDYIFRPETAPAPRVGPGKRRTPPHAEY